MAIGPWPRWGWTRLRYTVGGKEERLLFNPPESASKRIALAMAIQIYGAWQLAGRDGPSQQQRAPAVLILNERQQRMPSQSSSSLFDSPRDKVIFARFIVQ